MPETATLADLFVNAWPTIFAMDLSRYLIGAGTVALTLAVFAGPLAARRIQQRTATGEDVRREVSYSVSTVFLFSLIGFAVYAGSKTGVFAIYGGSLPSSSRLMLEFFAIVLMHDAYFYWAHRLMHTPRLFRWVHRLHHKSRTPTPWAAYSFAPPEAILEACILPLATAFIPMHELTIFLFVTHMIARNVIGHAGVELFPSWWLNVPLLRLITTTTHHDLHHSHGGYNFGLYFTWWDKLMKTEHPEYEHRFRMATQSYCPLKRPTKENSQ